MMKTFGLACFISDESDSLEGPVSTGIVVIITAVLNEMLEGANARITEQG